MHDLIIDPAPPRADIDRVEGYLENEKAASTRNATPAIGAT
jgi:hypothetical protein